MVQVVSWLKRFSSGWMVLVEKRPLIANSLVGGTLCGISDCFAQHIERGNNRLPLRQFQRLGEMQLSVKRLVAACLLGAFFGGVVYPTAYGVLDHIWEDPSAISILQKSVVEIATVGVFVNTVSMTFRGWATDSPGQTLPHVRKELPSLILSDAKVWLPYNLVAFSIIPPFVRPTTTALMEASWQTYISLRANDIDHYPE